MWKLRPDGRYELELLEWEKAERRASVASTGSAAPAEYAPLAEAPAIYRYISHDAQYGAGRRWGFSVRLLVVHTTETDNFTGSCRYNARRPQQVGCTAHVGRDGELQLGTPEENRPWTTGTWNDESLSVEVCGRRAWTESEWYARPRQLAALTDLLEDWCGRFNIPPVWLGPAEVAEGAGRHGEAPRMGTRRGVTDHDHANQAAGLLGRQTSWHNDIGPGLLAILRRDILPEVERRLASPSTGPTPLPTLTWRPPMASLHMLDQPTRLTDTRLEAGGPVTVGEHFEVKVTGPAGVTPKAAVITFTLVSANGGVHLSLDGALGTSANNLSSGAPPEANTTLVNVRDGKVRGTIGGAPGATVHVIADLIAVVS